MAFAITRIKKIKMQNQHKHSEVNSHNFRTVLHNNVDAEKTHLNRCLLGGFTPLEANKIRNNRWLELQEANDDKNGKNKAFRSDTVGSLEVLLAVSPGYFDSNDLELWVEAQKDFIVSEFGRENIVSMVLHLDETTPHIHCEVIPVVDNKLNAKMKVGNKAAMSKYQSRYALHNESLGLNRGLCRYELVEDKSLVETVKNKSNKQHKAETIKALKIEIQTLKHDLKIHNELLDQAENSVVWYKRFLNLNKTIKENFLAWKKETRIKENPPVEQPKTPLETIKTKIKGIGIKY